MVLSRAVERVRSTGVSRTSRSRRGRRCPRALFVSRRSSRAGGQSSIQKGEGKRLQCRSRTWGYKHGPRAGRTGRVRERVASGEDDGERQGSRAPARAMTSREWGSVADEAQDEVEERADEADGREAGDRVEDERQVDVEVGRSRVDRQAGVDPAAGGEKGRGSAGHTSRGTKPGDGRTSGRSRS